jgi:4-carboxymuconolactone decarboxylase
MNGLRRAMQEPSKGNPMNSVVSVLLVAAALVVSAGSGANAQDAPPLPSAPPPETRGSSVGQQETLVPGMAVYTSEVLFGDVWVRPQLSPRDRSLVVIAVLIATNKPDQLRGHLGRALTNGVLPTEASGVLTHLAVYAGWPTAVSALDVFEEVFTARKVDLASLRAVGEPLPVPVWEAVRAQAASDRYGAVAPKFTELTNRFVFGDLWRRADLAVRDRCLVTLAALAGMGDDGQLDFYLARAVENGLTRDQIAEAVTHLGFYAGWAKSTKAMDAVVRVLGD